MAVVFEPEEKWALAAGGLLVKVLDEPINELRSRLEKPQLQKHLSDYFQIRRDYEFAERLEWLRTSGFDAQYQEIAAQIGENGWDAVAESIAAQPDPVRRLHRYVATNMEDGGTGMVAWDQTLLILLARWGCTMNYLDEAAAWEVIFTAARRAQASYASWEAYGRDGLAGFTFWNWTLAVNKFTKPTDESRCRDAMNHLLGNQFSPWRQLPWDLPLGGEAAPPEETPAQASEEPPPAPPEPPPAPEPPASQSSPRRRRLEFE